MVQTLSKNPLVQNHDVTFKLDDKYVAKYRNRRPPFGFNGLGELVYRRTYSRIKADGTNEEWYETVRRVVEGTYALQKRWVVANHLGWSDEKAQESAQEMYYRIFTMKFLPPGRGLWAMGSPLTEERGLFCALNNCAMVSTANLAKDLDEPFTFLMEASMLGIGVGFDTKGAGLIKIHRPNEKVESYAIPDTREGWVESLRKLLRSYFEGGPTWQFDYSQIRPAGEPIHGFGGVAAGPEPLRQLHDVTRAILDKRAGRKITITDIVDIQNQIGKCVVAGNVRRTAEIAFGDPTSEEYLDLKNYEVNPHRADYGWTSNNSVFATLGMDYKTVAQRIRINGEPGIAWLENMQRYSRMQGPPDHKDKKVVGANPCMEQSLESYELCCLVECFPAHHESLDDFLRTLKFAYLYAKTVTLAPTPWTKTNRVMTRNRRIGCSMSGIVQTISKLGIEEFRQWCEEGYRTIRYWDEVYSGWLGVHESIKVTSVKPSGTVSLLAGATPGVHFPEARTYVRRIRIAKLSELVAPLREAGYPIEDCVGDESSLVVTVPVKLDGKLRTVYEVSMWEQLELAAFLQRHWSDNQVSATISFDPQVEGPQIAPALDYFQYRLKGISFLPRTPAGAYAQMPYEAINETEFALLTAGLKPLKLRRVANEQAEPDRFCDGETCQL